MQAGAGGAVSASVAADDAAVNRFLLDLVRWGSFSCLVNHHFFRFADLPLGGHQALWSATAARVD